MPGTRQSDLLTAAKNAEIVRRQYDLLNAGDVAAAVLFYAPDAMNHGRSVGREGFRQVLSDIIRLFQTSMWRSTISSRSMTLWSPAQPSPARTQAFAACP
jgi:hypothetical protein